MTAPNVEIDRLPTIRSFASVSLRNQVNIGNTGPYYLLSTGVSTVTITMRGGGGQAHLSTEKDYRTRFHSVDVPEGRPVVLANVSCPVKSGRYLAISPDKEGIDVGITIITYPL